MEKINTSDVTVLLFRLMLKDQKGKRSHQQLKGKTRRKQSVIVRWLAGDCKEHGTRPKAGALCMLLVEELV